MQCKECGATFIQNREWQRFCCTQHRNAYNQRNFYQREQKQKSDYLIASSDINILKQEIERLKAQLNAKESEIQQLEQLSDKLNGDLEQSSLRPNPNITIDYHSAPTAAQARYFASIGKRNATKDFKQRFSNMTREEIHDLTALLEEMEDNLPKQLNDPKTIDHK
jgi:hypothetical protein